MLNLLRGKIKFKSAFFSRTFTTTHIARGVFNKQFYSIDYLLLRKILAEGD